MVKSCRNKTLRQEMFISPQENNTGSVIFLKYFPRCSASVIFLVVVYFSFKSKKNKKTLPFGGGRFFFPRKQTLTVGGFLGRLCFFVFVCFYTGSD